MSIGTVHAQKRVWKIQRANCVRSRAATEWNKIKNLVVPYNCHRRVSMHVGVILAVYDATAAASVLINTGAVHSQKDVRKFCRLNRDKADGVHDYAFLIYAFYD